MTVDWRPVTAGLLSAAAALSPDETIHAARAAIAGYPAAPLDLTGLAAIAGYSTHHFVRRFARVVGQTPGRYQTSKRMELARHLLETTDLDVTAVCGAVGYASLGSFSDAFARAHGRPPTAWRRRMAALAGLRPRTAPVPSCYAHRHVDPEELRNLGEAVAEAAP